MLQWNILWGRAKHAFCVFLYRKYCLHGINKAHLEDLIAATGLLILLNLGSNRGFFVLFDPEIQWMTLKNYRTPLLYYVKRCASFQIYRWIQTGVTVWNAQFGWIGDYVSRCDHDIWWMTLKNNSTFFYALHSVERHFDAMGDLNCSYSPVALNSGQNRRFVVLCELEIWWMTLKKNKASLLYHVKFCASFRSHF